MEEFDMDSLISMGAELAELERAQIEILQHITDLEDFILGVEISRNLSISSNDDSAAVGTTTEDRLSALLRENGVNNFAFRRVSSDYYQWSLEARRDVLGAASVNHLCKSIVLVNTQAPSNVTDCKDRYNSKYYVVILQYTARFNAEAVKNFLYTLNNGNIAKKKFNMRLAPEEISRNLTGYEHNGVTCIGMKTDIPEVMLFFLTRNETIISGRPNKVILDEAITKLQPEFFWLGGGKVDLKLGINTHEFIHYVKPFIVSCSSSS
ncbi:unnamed protein product [Cuscuta campestris]|uniref:YbaK/aminoacyl-tRNA synthetase-associated domain-containing protein n=1 Tax=Cuscuta campestris TaxID=132261 RepID=A0A484L350_9ASTE|nr:unnamed protein product [Cuscuta campestris]